MAIGLVYTDWRCAVAWLQNKRAIKRTEDNPGGLISVEVGPFVETAVGYPFSTGLSLANANLLLQSPIHYSNVMLADPVTGKPVRTQWRFLEDGTKVRACGQ